MKYNELYKNGPQVSVIGFGAWAIGGREWGKTDDTESLRALHRAAELGINFFDTADIYGYGHSEELIGKFLREYDREKVVIAGKAGRDFYRFLNTSDLVRFEHTYTAAYLTEAVEKSLKRLGTDRLDVLQLHSPDTELLKADEPWIALDKLKQSGKIVAAGLSVQSYKETEQTFLVDEKKDILDCLQIRYNLLERQAEESLLDTAKEHGIGVIARIPILFGLLAGKFNDSTRFGKDDHRSKSLAPEILSDYMKELAKYDQLFARRNGHTQSQISIGFCISHPAVSTVIPGAKTPQQVEENAKAAYIPVDFYKDIAPLSKN